MPRSYDSLTLDDARRMLSSAEAKAATLGIAYNVAVVDAGGHLLAFERQDGALIGSIDLAIDKAVTARIFDKATSELASLSQSGRPLFGIQESNAGKVVIFGGGVPVRWGGTIVGAVGASAGTVEQDIEVAEAAIAALGGSLRSSLWEINKYIDMMRSGDIVGRAVMKFWSQERVIIFGGCARARLGRNIVGVSDQHGDDLNGILQWRKLRSQSGNGY